MLRGQAGRIWKGTYDLNFEHHSSAKELKHSKDIDCAICGVLFDELNPKLAPDTSLDNLPINVTASLYYPSPRVEHLYRLDLKLRCDRQKIRCQRTFVLKETGQIPNLQLDQVLQWLTMHQDTTVPPPFRTPISSNTSSDEVFQLVMQWICRCNCVATDSEAPLWYPRRLISLGKLKTRDSFLANSLESLNRVTDTEVNLVETEEWENKRPAHGDVRYVTLSHCWGKKSSYEHTATSAQLNDVTMGKFKEGIKLDSLPKTFRDAMEFAARLPRVGFIWIDSLCIIQGDKADWLEQSAVMDRVYNKAWLNISATAAANSSEGLFNDRTPELLLENEVTLNIAGLPGTTNLPQSWTSPRVSLRPKPDQDLPVQAPQNEDQSEALPEPEDLSTLKTDISSLKRSDTSLSKDSQIGRTAEGDMKVKRNDLRRCTLLDASFWTDRVDEAPVNKRGWVLQERLMAPRVLHFCRDQVAWECSDFEAAEGQPEGIPNFQLTIDGLRDGSRLKRLDVMADGRWLRCMRLQDHDDPDPHLQPDVYALELWSHIVEVYSKTSVTNSGDKLIALSGMARWMSQRVAKSEALAQLRYTSSIQNRISHPRNNTHYVAGLWMLHLASQLLWFVDPTFQGLDGSFHHHTTAPDEYRAPSFSWACIDSENGNGITYGEITDRDVLINIEQVSITPKAGSDEFGILDDAHILLQGQLHRVVIVEQLKGRFGWHLIGRGKLDEDQHTIMYLDCPSRDQSGFLHPDAEVFVVPAAKGPRTASEESKYLICLILQRVHGRSAGPAYRRIGLTKLSPYGDHLALDELEISNTVGSDEAMLPKGFDAETSMHPLLLI
jgi:hypothetical protein